MDKRPWSAPPRYLFRKYNVIDQFRKVSGAKTFIDVGCGAGDLACSLVKEFKMKGIGIDFNDEAIKIAEDLRRFYGLKLHPEFKKLNSEEIKKISPADAVFCMEVLEHIKDDKKLLNDLVKLSNKYVVLSVPAKKKFFAHSDELAGHYRRYEKEELMKLIDESGLVVKSFVAYGYPFTNIIRWLRELLSAKVKRSQGLSSMEKRSKKSGTDLLGVNKLFTSWMSNIIYPLYHISRIFNSTDLSEGYLVVCEKVT